MNKLTSKKMLDTQGGKMSPIGIIAGCTLLAAAAGGAAISSGVTLAFVGIAALLMRE
ncbi:hypothetical protein ACFSUS_08375 [Spirosoma soli]|uniref:Lipoprotein n=1 Tax=Spirosoma soli TaxID=1770529 RepID=A0ABW5M397_9BACT